MFRVLLVLAMLFVSNSVFGQYGAKTVIHEHDGYTHGHQRQGEEGDPSTILVGYTPPTPNPAPDPQTDKSYIHYHDEEGKGSIVTPHDGDPLPPVNQEPVNQPPVNQPPVNQPTVQQPTVNQPTVTQPTLTSSVVSTTPAAEPASQGQPQTSQPASDNTPIKRITQPQQKPIITEYMLRDYSRSGGAGLPQWIEIYNPNDGAMELWGYQFTYAWRNTANSPYKYKTETIDSFIIPAGEAKIIVGKKIEARETRWNTVAGLSDEDIWVIPSEENWVSLKDGWHLADPSGEAIYRIGGAFEEKPANAEWDDSIPWKGNVRVPPHTSEGFRVSYQAVPSELPDEDHFYGNIEDRSAVAVVVNSKTTYELVGKSSPGFCLPIRVVPAAPSLLRPKKVVIWGNLKRAK